MTNTSKGVLFLPPSDAYVRSFLYLLYTLIKLYYTKALSDQASSLAPDWILLWGPRILESLHGSATTFHRFMDLILQHSNWRLKAAFRDSTVTSSSIIVLPLTVRSWHLVPSLHGKWMGKQWKQWLTLFFWAPKSLQIVTAAMKLKDAYSLEGKLWPTWTAYWKAETLLCQQRSI